ncbi:MAG: hypothetical protein ACPGU7_10625 [Gammaproteobacteria bacterium]
MPAVQRLTALFTIAAVSVLSFSAHAAPRLTGAYWPDRQVMVKRAGASSQVSGDRITITLPSGLSPAKIRGVAINVCLNFSAPGSNVPLINVSSAPKVIVPLRYTSIRQVTGGPSCHNLNLSGALRSSPRPQVVRLDFISGKTKKTLSAVIKSQSVPAKR